MSMNSRCWCFCAVLSISVLLPRSAAVAQNAQNLSGTYRIMTVGSGRYWHENGGADMLVSTFYQPDDDFTRFILQRQSDGSYRIVVKGDGKHLHVDGSGDQLLSVRYQPDDEFTRFFFERDPSGAYRIRVKADNAWLHENGGGDQLVSTRYQPDDEYTRFRLIPVGSGGEMRPEEENTPYVEGGAGFAKAPIQSRSDATVTEPEHEENGNLVKTERIDASRSLDTTFVLENNSASVVFPGSMMYGEDLNSGKYTTLASQFAPGKITLSTNIAIADRGSPRIQVDHPTLSNTRAALNRLIVQQRLGPAEANMEFLVTEVHSKDQMELEIGGRFGYGGFSVDNQFGMKKDSERRTVLAKFVQEYYTVDVDEMAARDHFANPTDWEIVRKSGKTPLYIGTVKYGRAYYFMLKTTMESQEIENTLNLAYESVGVKADATVRAKFSRLLETSEMKCLVIGGDAEIAAKAIGSYEGFVEAIRQGASFGENRLGRPIAYTLRFIDDGSVAYTNVVTNYVKRTVTKDTGTYKVTLRYLTCPYVSYDENADDSNGCEELYGSVSAGFRDNRVSFSNIQSLLDAQLQGRLEIQSVPVMSYQNLLYLEHNPAGEVSKYYQINRSFTFTRKNSVCPVENFELNVGISLQEYDTFSAIDSFNASLWIPLSSVSNEFGETYVEAKSGTDTIRLYYTVEVVE